MSKEIWYTLHIMWYEHEMLEEHLASLQASLEYASVPVKLFVCLNHQTYIESPIVDNRKEIFDKIASHPLLKDATIVQKYDSDAFYNIGDWRRETVNPNGYTSWGEIDTLLPEQYFYILSALLHTPEYDKPHALSFASRKMWDNSWLIVEHEILAPITTVAHDDNTDYPMNWHDYITQDQLDKFNEDISPQIVKLGTCKFDGSLLSLHSGLPQLIPDELHFAREDFCAQSVCEVWEIPQYHVTNILKGHNYKHPNKRVNTNSSREDSPYKKYEQESYEAMNKFIWHNIGIRGQK